MKIHKWVDMGQEVEIEISMEDVRQSLAEAFAECDEDCVAMKPQRGEILTAINRIATFLRAMTDDQIKLLSGPQRDLIAAFLSQSADRFRIGAADMPVETSPQLETKAATHQK